jgi:hypothetical protein
MLFFFKKKKEKEKEKSTDIICPAAHFAINGYLVISTFDSNEVTSYWWATR